MKNFISKSSIQFFMVIRYFQIENKTGLEIIAATGRDAVLSSLGDINDPLSIASTFEFKLNTLMQVSESIAKKTKLYDKFQVETPLCADGTYVLGTLPIK